MFINTRKFLNTPSGLIPSPSHTRTHPALAADRGGALGGPGGSPHRSAAALELPGAHRCGSWLVGTRHRPGLAAPTRLTPGSLLPLQIFTAVLSSFSTRPSLSVSKASQIRGLWHPHPNGHLPRGRVCAEGYADTVFYWVQSQLQKRGHVRVRALHLFAFPLFSLSATAEYQSESKSITEPGSKAPNDFIRIITRISISNWKERNTTSFPRQYSCLFTVYIHQGWNSAFCRRDSKKPITFFKSTPSSIIKN